MDWHQDIDIDGPTNRISASYRVQAIFTRVSHMLHSVVQTARLWQARINERRELDNFDDRTLIDIGTSREEILRETRKPFWRV